MGAKFKAALDSRCFAEEQRFRLPLSLLQCLFILFFAVFPPLVLCVFVSFMTPFDSFHLLFSSSLILFSVSFIPFPGSESVVPLGLCSIFFLFLFFPTTVLTAAAVAAAAGMLSSQRTISVLEQEPLRRQSWVGDRHFLLISPGSKPPPLSSSSPCFLLRRRRFHNCLTLAICSLRGLQRPLLMQKHPFEFVITLRFTAAALSAISPGFSNTAGSKSEPVPSSVRRKREKKDFYQTSGSGGVYL